MIRPRARVCTLEIDEAFEKLYEESPAAKIISGADCLTKDQNAIFKKPAASASVTPKGIIFQRLKTCRGKNTESDSGKNVNDDFEETFDENVSIILPATGTSASNEPAGQLHRIVPQRQFPRPEYAREPYDDTRQERVLTNNGNHALHSGRGEPTEVSAPPAARQHESPARFRDKQFKPMPGSHVTGGIDYADPQVADSEVVALSAHHPPPKDHCLTLRALSLFANGPLANRAPSIVAEDGNLSRIGGLHPPYETYMADSSQPAPRSPTPPPPLSTPSRAKKARQEAEQRAKDLLNTSLSPIGCQQSAVGSERNRKSAPALREPKAKPEKQNASFRDRAPSKEAVKRKQNTKAMSKAASAAKKQEVTKLERWVIRPVAGGFCVEGHRVGDPEGQFWHSSAICVRISDCTVATQSGSQYKLVGQCDRREMIQIGFDKAMIAAFKKGFPTKWKSILKGVKLNRSMKDDQKFLSAKDGTMMRKGTSGGDTSVSHRNPRPQQISVEQSMLRSPSDVSNCSISRSGRRVYPSLAWWRSERLVLDPDTQEYNVEPGSNRQLLPDYQEQKKSILKRGNAPKTSNNAAVEVNGVPSLDARTTLPVAAGNKVDADDFKVPRDKIVRKVARRSRTGDSKNGSREGSHPVQATGSAISGAATPQTGQPIRAPDQDSRSDQIRKAGGQPPSGRKRTGATSQVTSSTPETGQPIPAHPRSDKLREAGGQSASGRKRTGQRSRSRETARASRRSTGSDTQSGSDLDDAKSKAPAGIRRSRRSRDSDLGSGLGNHGRRPPHVTKLDQRVGKGAASALCCVSAGGAPTAALKESVQRGGPSDPATSGGVGKDGLGATAQARCKAKRFTNCVDNSHRAANGEPSASKSRRGQGGPDEGHGEPSASKSRRGQGGPDEGHGEPSASKSRRGQGGSDEGHGEPSASKSRRVQGGPDEGHGEPSASKSRRVQGGPDEGHAKPSASKSRRVQGGPDEGHAEPSASKSRRGQSGPDEGHVEPSASKSRRGQGGPDEGTNLKSCLKKNKFQRSGRDNPATMADPPLPIPTARASGGDESARARSDPKAALNNLPKPQAGRQAAAPICALQFSEDPAAGARASGPPGGGVQTEDYDVEKGVMDIIATRREARQSQKANRPRCYGSPRVVLTPVAQQFSRKARDAAREADPHGGPLDSTRLSAGRGDEVQYDILASAKNEQRAVSRVARAPHQGQGQGRQCQGRQRQAKGRRSRLSYEELTSKSETDSESESASRQRQQRRGTKTTKPRGQPGSSSGSRGRKSRESTKRKTPSGSARKGKLHERRDKSDPDDRPWSVAELDRLKEATQQIDLETANYWDVVADHVGSRPAEECRRFHYRDVPLTSVKKKRQEKPAKSVTEPAAITARVGTMKRKRQLRELVENHDQDYQDDLFDSTPYKKMKTAEIPGLSNESYLGADFADINEYQTPAALKRSSVLTPCGRFNPTTPLSSPSSPGILATVDRKDMDAYIQRLQRVTKTKNAGKAGQPAARSASKGNTAARALSKQGQEEDLFKLKPVPQRESSDEEDFYFSD